MLKKISMTCSVFLLCFLLITFNASAGTCPGSYTSVSGDFTTTGSTTLSGTLESGQDETYDYYQIVVTKNARYTIQTSGSLDTYGVLIESNTDGSFCNTIDQNDNQNADSNFKIVKNLELGKTYYVGVRGAEHCITKSGRKCDEYGYDTGSFTLDVAWEVDDYGNSCDTAEDLGDSTTYTLTGNLEVEADQDFFRFEVTNAGGADISISTSSLTGGIETVGTLYDENCNYETRSVGNDNFSMSYSVTEPGVYFLKVNDNPQQTGGKKGGGYVYETGSYTLNISLTPYTLKHTITPYAGTGGTISPGTPQQVEDGGSITFTIAVVDGISIKDVLVDGVSQGAVASYEFSGVTEDHSISASFNLPPGKCNDISDVPLDARVKSAPANIMFVLDDSGSMDWEFVTEENDGKFSNASTLAGLSSGGTRLDWKSQWNGYNKIYYNPDEEYVPWPLKSDVADPDNPPYHPETLNDTFALTAEFDSVDDAASSSIIIDQADSTGFSRTPEGTFAIVDDDDDGFTYSGGSGGWAVNSSESDDAYNGYYHYTRDEADDYIATWNANLSTEGSYSVYAWWHEADRNSTSVAYTITHADGTSTVTKNQEESGGQWVLLGSYNFDAGGGVVSFTHDVTDCGKKGCNDRAVADAVKFEADFDAWGSATNSQAQDGWYLYTTQLNTTYQATWTPSISGEYEVFVRYVDGADRSTAVPYTVYHTGGATTVSVDQTVNGGTWVSLGTYTLDSSSYVMLNHTVTGTNQVAVADAVKFTSTSAAASVSIKWAHYYVTSADGYTYLVNFDGSNSDTSSTIKYYRFDDLDGDDRVDAGEMFTVASGSVPSDVDKGSTFDDYQRELQNFANWYTFYRKRLLTSIAATARVIYQMRGVYVGMYSIQQRIRETVHSIHAGGTDQTSELLNTLYGLESGNGTPLRNGLLAVGRYYDQDDNIKLDGTSGNDSPFASAEEGGTCQQAFAIVMTDGYWNGNDPNVGDQDADTGSDYDGEPYADGYEDSLADVAMKYYKEDLSDTLENSIPGNAKDSATHQHMVTYTVPFGVQGSLDYQTDVLDVLAADGNPAWTNPYDGDTGKIDDMMHAAVNGRGQFLVASNPQELIDSLLRVLQDIESRLGSASSVTVNGDELYAEVNMNLRIFQSNYFSENWTGNVLAFRMDAFGDIDTESVELNAQEKIEAQNWNTGRMIATFTGSQGIPFRWTDVNTNGMGTLLDSDSTTAQNMLNYIRGDRTNEEANGGAFRDRSYLLGDIVHSSPVFKHKLLYTGGNDGMLHALDADPTSATYGNEIFAYVPNLVFDKLNLLTDPDYSHEFFVDLTPVAADVDFTSSGARNVTTLLVGGLGKGGKGYYALDISGATAGTPPVIVTETDVASRVLWEYPSSGGTTKVKNITGASNTAPIVITSASHTFLTGDTVVVSGVVGNDAANGQWVITRLNANEFSLNGSDGTADGAYTSGGTATWTENNEIGYSYSRPVIVKSNDSGKWIVIFGNGYNSDNSYAALFIIDPIDGSLLKKISTEYSNDCNGLSTPMAIDANYDGTVDYVFAGDLQGNLWKFDLTNSDSAYWDVAYHNSTTGLPAPVFQAKDEAGNPQAITTRPDVMYHPSGTGFMIVFGTGKYMGEEDISSDNVHTIYGIWDYGDDDDDSEYLGSFERSAASTLSNQASTVTLLEQTEIWSVEMYDVGSLSQENIDFTTQDDATENQDPDPAVHAGWYFDLPIQGERVTTDPIIRNNHAIVISYVPDDTPCAAGGYSIINEISASSGARLDEPPFDVNGDGEVSSDSTKNEDGSLVDAGDWVNTGTTEAPALIAGSRIRKTGRLMTPAIAKLDEDTEIKIMSSSKAQGISNIQTLKEKALRLGIRFWMEIQE